MAKRKTKRKTTATRRRRVVSQSTKLDLMKTAKIVGAGLVGLLAANKGSQIIGEKFGDFKEEAAIAIPAAVAVGTPFALRALKFNDSVISNAMIAGSGIVAVWGLLDLLKMQDMKKHVLAGDDTIELDLNDPAELQAFAEAAGALQQNQPQLVSGDIMDYDNPAMGHYGEISAANI